jgi:hypothetical protein
MSLLAPTGLAVAISRNAGAEMAASDDCGHAARHV